MAVVLTPVLKRGDVVQSAISKETITRGLKYSLATGNWGLQGTAGLRAGVSQVACFSYPQTQ